MDVFDDDWITTENKVHIPIKEGENKEQACKEFFEKKQETIKNIKTIFNEIVEGKTDEKSLSNVRNDLKQYGGTNEISFIKGNIKGGIEHLNIKHKEDIDGVINALVNGDVIKYVQNRKVQIEQNGYVALLSLDYFGKKKTWLLTGYKNTNKEP